MDRKQLKECLTRLTHSEKIPGASYSIVWKNHVMKDFVGLAQIEPEKRYLTEETIYDLASLTKVVSTTTLFLKALEEGYLTLDMPVKDIISDFPYEDVRMEDLLTHRAGYPAMLENRDAYRGKEEMVQAAKHHRRLAKSGEQVLYSDISFILLGHILELAYQKRLDVLLDEKILIPMDMRNTFYNPPQKREYAATEHKEGRGYICGEVHDTTAYRMNGISGHAGLFSNIDDLSRFVQMILNDGQHDGRQIMSPSSLRLLKSIYYEGKDEMRTLGWQVNEKHHYCDLASEKALYHTGFTGTSILIDEDKAFILLSNAVHPNRDKSEFVKVRKQIHNIAMAIENIED